MTATEKTADSISKLAHDFLRQIQTRNKIRLLPFDPSRWFRGAYSTIQRTLRDSYQPLDEAQKQDLSRRLFTELLRNREISSEEFSSLIVGAAAEHQLSVGHMQKIVGMLCKYSFVGAKVSAGDIPEEINGFVKKNEKHLPVPIDNYVLRELATEFSDRFLDISRTGATFRVAEDNGPVAWSRMQNIETWGRMQNRISELALEHGLSPMAFEMRYLWVVAPTQKHDPVQGKKTPKSGASSVDK